MSKKMFDRLSQADSKPEEPEKFGDINDLVKSVGALKIEEPKKQGGGSSPCAKPAAYRRRHPAAKNNAAANQQELFGSLAPSGSGETSKSALRNKKRREKQREKQAAEGSAADGNDD